MRRSRESSRPAVVSAARREGARAALIKATVAAIHTLGTCGALSQAGLVGDQDVLKVSPGLIYRATERLELSLEAFHIAAGCNTTAGTTWSLGAALTR